MFALLAAVALVADPADRPDFSGVVQDDKGRPLAKATVFVRTAGPRKGVGVL
jgi:hypothetical protein